MKSILNKFNASLSVVPPQSDEGSSPDSDNPILSDIYGSIEDLSGRSLELAQLTSHSSTHRITIRYSADVTSGCYVVADDQTYIIDAINDPGKPLRKVYLVLYCHKVNDGI